MKAKKPSPKPAAKKPGKKKVGDIPMPMARPTGPVGGLFGSRPVGTSPSPATTRPPGPTPGTKFAIPPPPPPTNPGYGPPKRNEVLYARRHPKKGI